MYLFLGQGTVVLDRDILGIFDMENTTVMKSTVHYLNRAQKEKEVSNVAPYELPKSFVVCQNKAHRTIYISPSSVGTLLRRTEQKNEG